jgi:hypothetical protein
MPYLETCPACVGKRPHTDEEYKLHPGEGREGFNRSDGQTEKKEPEAK